MATRKISDEQLEEAKKQFMDYTPVAVIARNLDVPRMSVQYHAEKWKAERNLQKAELMQQLAEAKKSDFASILLNSTKIIKRAIQDLADREEPPTAREAKNMAEVIEKFDKILRLDNGAPTEITEERAVDPAEMQRKLRMDPFLKEDIVDADFKEVTKDSN